MLCSTFRYYCRLGPTTQGANSDDFVTVRPTQAALEEEANHVALGASERLFGSLSISRADGEEDELLAGRPPEALSLAQFRQLLLDCTVLGTECRLADVGRLFTLCARPIDAPPPRETNEWEALEADDSSARRLQRQRIAAIPLNELCPPTGLEAPRSDGLAEDVHDMRRRLNIYGFVECLVRVAATKFGAPHSLLSASGPTKSSSSPAPSISALFDRLLIDNILPFSCSHERVTAHRWDALRPDADSTHSKYQAQIWKVFGFFRTLDAEAANRRRRGASETARAQAVDPKGKGFIAHGTSAALYARFCECRPQLVDQTLSFNQLLHMLEEAGITCQELPPRRVAALWTDVTGYPAVQPTVEKANLSAEMTRAEFYECILAIRRVLLRNNLGRPISIETWLQETFFPKVNSAMPFRGDALVRSTTVSDHYLSTQTAHLKVAKDRLRRVPIFAEVAGERFVEIVGAALQPRSVEADTQIISVGETGTEMFFVVDGEVEVSTRGQAVAVMGPGNFFGEMSLLCDEPRNADVRATSHTELFALSKAALLGAVAEYPRLAEGLRDEMETRRLNRAAMGTAVEE